MLQALTIARNTFVDSLRQPVFFIIVAISGILQVLATWGTNFSMGMASETSEVTYDDKLLFDVGLSTIFVCGALLAGFIATAMLSREIERKTVLTVVSKPISRASVVIGKYLGVSVAILMATLMMVAFLLLGLRHGVLSTAADSLDGPVLLVACLVAFMGMGIGAWCNFYYGWHFSQTAVLVMFPLSVLGYVGVLAVNPDWELQAMTEDFLPQVTLACLCLVMAIMVLTSVALAASARLGQVMTIVVCVGVFVFGLLTNHFVGRQVYDNRPIGQVSFVEPTEVGDERFSEPGDSYRIRFVRRPAVDLPIGTQIYWGPSATGAGFVGEEFPASPPEVDEIADFFDGPQPARVVVSDNTEMDERWLTVEIVGRPGLKIDRLPRGQDFVFTKPTSVNPVALGVWGIVPNMQVFWLVDAVSQNQLIPIGHVILVCGYGLVQIVGFLALAVMLFQTRDVG